MRAVGDLDEAVRALEATLARQLLQASKAFGGGDGPGSQIRTDMFIETLADVLAEGQGLGLGPLLRASLETSGAEATEVLSPLGEFGRPRGLNGLTGAPLALPAEGEAGAHPRVSSEFGRRVDPLAGDGRFHAGIDLAMPAGTPVRAALAGVVKGAGARGGYGNAVEIDHGNGLTTLYGHNAHLEVEPGQRVKAGQIIAEVGQSGRATGPHLHLEVRVDGKPTNPRAALNAYRVRVEDTVAAEWPLSPKEGDKR
ncbi:MAG: M23 family metallopeptidase [Myxococcales bacterium]|nr:M23 family metallopeptidase [Myxococcales bacterium]